MHFVGLCDIIISQSTVQKRKKNFTYVYLINCTIYVEDQSTKCPQKIGAKEVYNRKG